jgi:hypothetical protein
LKWVYRDKKLPRSFFKMGKLRLHGDFIADYSRAQDEPKWVYSPKKLERKKIRVEYFSFQGGDLLPLLVQYYYSTHYAPATHHDPTDLNTSASDVPDTVSNGHNTSDQRHHPHWVSDPTES